MGKNITSPKLKQIENIEENCEDEEEHNSKNNSE